MILHKAGPDRAYLVEDDPVRPNISYAFRTSVDKDFFVYENELTGDAAACICVSYNDQVPTSMLMRIGSLCSIRFGRMRKVREGKSYLRPSIGSKKTNHTY